MVHLELYTRADWPSFRCEILSCRGALPPFGRRCFMKHKFPGEDEDWGWHTLGFLPHGVVQCLKVEFVTIDVFFNAFDDVEGAREKYINIPSEKYIYVHTYVYICVYTYLCKMDEYRFYAGLS